MSAAETARLLSKLDLDDSGFQRGISRSLGSLGKLDKGVGRIGKGAGQLGGGLLKVGAVAATAIGAGLVFAGKAAVDYDEAFQGVVKTVDASKAKFDELHGALLQMSTDMPISATELANIAAAGGQMGVKAKDIESFTKQVAILASTTNVSSDQAATALGQLQNVIGLTGAEFDNFAAALVDLGNKGSSTEADILEVERRAGGAAKLIGVAKDATLGWAAAAANLGLNQELAGTALQKFFIMSQQLVSKGGKGLTGFAKVAGMTSKDFAKAFQRDASGALDTFLNGLAKLPKDKRLKTIDQFFGKGTGMTRLLVGLSSSIKQNLDPALADSAKAWKEATAAQAEFDKRNQTVQSQLTRLWNTIKLGAVTIGEGFTPAVGRAADRLSKFIKDPENIAQLKKIGQDIGDAIDKIDFDKLFTAAKNLGKALDPALQVLLKIADLIAKLPPDVLGAGAGLIVANKISGGAITAGAGNIIGGLGESFAKAMIAKVPLFGSAFVQPVLVTNWAASGLGGVGGGAAGGVAGAVEGIAPALAPMSLAALGGTALFGAALASITSTVEHGLTDALASAVSGNKVNGQDLGDVVRQAAEQASRQNFLTSLGDLINNPGGALNKTADAVNQLTDFMNRPHPDFLGDLGKLLAAQYHPDQKPAGTTAAPGGMGSAGSKFFGPKPSTSTDPWRAVGEHARIVLQVPAIQALSAKFAGILSKLHDANREGNTKAAANLRQHGKELQAKLTALETASRAGTSKQVTAEDRVQTAALAGVSATRQGTGGTTIAVNAATGRIVGAIANTPPPIVNVDVSVTASGVQKSVTTSKSYGEQNGSAGGGGTHAGPGGASTPG